MLSSLDKVLSLLNVVFKDESPEAMVDEEGKDKKTDKRDELKVASRIS